LDKLVESVSSIPGVVAIILFGSVARGEADEYSDIDVLVLFKNRDSLWRGWDSVFRETGRMNLNIHVIPQTLGELSEANSLFVEDLQKHGKVLFARSPFNLLMGLARGQPFSIISYDLSALSSREKMRVVYRLYEGGGKGGVVGRSGGMKLAAGCVLVPQDECFALISFLKTSGAKALKIDVLLLENGKKKRRGFEQFQREENRSSSATDLGEKKRKI
jgi:predicted nucleotidyltransferase